MRIRRARTLSAQIMLWQVLILLVPMLAAFGASVWRLHVQLDQQYEQRALGVAKTVAAMPQVVDAVQGGHPGGALESLAVGIGRTTGAAYVVVTDVHGIRYTHPNPQLIGTPVSNDPEPRNSEPFRTGVPWMGIQRGTVGITARGKAPIFSTSGRLLGEVSVGFPVGGITQHMEAELPTYGLLVAGALAVGVTAALALSMRLKRRTFGLELDELSGLLQEREATLHGIREGVLGYDVGLVVRFANDRAREQLALPADVVGRRVAELDLPPRLAGLLAGDPHDRDVIVLVNQRVLVANRMPVRVGGRHHVGWAITLHDRTETEGLLHELDTVLGLTEALRAQSHEFRNRMHVIVGLLRTGRTDEAVSYASEVAVTSTAFAGELLRVVSDPMIVALLIAKGAVANERGVDLRIDEVSMVDGTVVAVHDVLTVLGNLVDNAIDAVAAAPAPRWIRVLLLSRGGELILGVADSGPGVPPGRTAEIFRDGFSTKPPRQGITRGLGLALVRQIVDQRHGHVEVTQQAGALFTVTLPGVIRAEASRAVPAP